MKATFDNKQWQFQSTNGYESTLKCNVSANKASEDYHAVLSRLQMEKRSLFQNMICCAEAESLAS